ncbi:MAG TPA: hypothetical protein VF706_00070, partial [Solirubrobacteraceae bacterium]
MSADSTRAGSGAGSTAPRRGRALPALALGLAVALVLGGCETTAEKSAKLERSAKHVKLAQKGLSITKQSTQVRVLGTSVVHSSEGAAATVTLQNRSAHTLRGVPIAIVVKDAGGRTAFQNDAPGLEAALVSVPSLAPHATLTWVDDQLPAGSAPASVSARVGEAPVVSGAIPKLTISGARLAQEASGAVATGTIANHSAIEQRALVVFAVVRQGARVLAAGRAVLPQLAAGASTQFQVYF